MSEKETTEAEVLSPDRMKVIIPQCCREGWDTCKHVVNRPKRKKKRNIGL